MSEKNDRGSTSADKMTKLLSVTVNDKSKLEPILEFCQFAVEKGYYSDKHQLVPMYWQESVLEGKVHTV